MLACLAWPLRGDAQGVLRPIPHLQDATTGLPAREVRDVVEDTHGDLWLATELGLLRFDGRRYRRMPSARERPAAALSQLHVDPHGRLWGLTAAQQLLVWSDDRQRVHLRPAPRQAGTAPPLRIAHLSSDLLGMWVGSTAEGAYVWRDATGWLRVRGLPSPRITALARDLDGGMWVGTANGLAYGRSAQLRPVAAWPSTPVVGLSPDPRGGVWVTTARAVFHIAHVDAMPVRTHATAAHVLLRGEAGETWQQQPDGLVLMHAAGVQRVALPSAPGQRVPAIRQVREDRNGGVWLRSDDHRLWRLPPRWQQFTALASAAGLRDPHARALAASSDGRVWVAGSHGNLQQLDPRTGVARRPAAFAGELAEARTLGMAEDAQGRVWMATDARLLRYDPARRQWRRWPLPVEPGPGRLAVAVCRDGAVWIAANDHVQRRDADGVVHLQGAPAALGWTPPSSAVPMLCARDGTLWVGDRRGLRRWLPAQERFAGVSGGVAGAISAVAEDAQGHLWTSGPGALQRYRWDGQRLHPAQRFDAAQGYPQLDAQALAVDAAGMAWSGSARGLVRANPHTGRIRLFDRADGVPVQQVMPQRLRTLSDGTLVAAVREGGVLLFDPARVRDPSRRRGLRIDAVSVHREETMTRLPVAGTVRLRSSDRNVRVAVRLAGHDGSARVRYRFALRGMGNDGVDTGSLGQRMFARLPPGRHVLDVQALPGDGRAASHASLVLEVAPGVWQAPRGRLAIIVVLGAGTALGARACRRHARRQRRALHRQEQRQRAAQVSQARTDLLLCMGRDVRVPMTTVLGWSEALQHAPLTVAQRDQVRSLHRAGEHLMQLMDDALDVAQVEAGTPQLQRVAFDLPALLHDLQALLQPVAQARGVLLHWQVDPAARRGFLGDPARLRQVLLNLLGNALKFTAQGQVVLEAAYTGPAGGLRLRVTDTGPGLDPAQQRRIFQRFEQADGARTAARHGGTGLGLAISRQLAQAMGGDITLTSVVGEGSCFTLQLPLPPARTPAGAGDIAQATRQRPRALRLLVVAPAVADVIAALLRQLGHDVQIGDGRAPELAMAAPAWDAILVDPALGDAAGRIGMRLGARWPGVPRLALSACSAPQAARLAHAGGYAAFLRLPVTTRHLATALQQCVGP
ncbi:ATP-binding protein [Stenotrophomonas sp. GZD-301]|uniref:hybrid sensor histidine kinase/response regulator n=1 Tax=Stenotrophomonas sp. GZD-301 TaxID=3404814 RepID=UPI003BB79F27